MFQRTYLRASLPHPSKIGARQYGMLAEEQMRRRREHIEHAQELSRLAKQKRDENEYHETKTLKFNCIANGVLNMDKIARVICNLRSQNALNPKAYDKFVHSEQAMTAVPHFDDLNVGDNKSDIWLNILADRQQVMFQRGSVRSSLPPPSKLGARQYGLIVEEQMRRRREDMKQVHDHRRFNAGTQIDSEYHETKNSMFNCISHGMLHMDQIAKVIWNLKQRRVLNQKAYDEFVHSDEAATAVSKFDGLYISGDERDIWYNIMANRLQCEINRALIHRNAKKENVQGYYILQEVELLPENTTITSEEPGIENLKK